MIALGFVILAGICNAVMDVCQHKWGRSIFSVYKRQYWDPAISWKNKYVDWDSCNNERVRFLKFGKFKGFVKPVSLTDGWHLFKRLMLIFLAIAVVVYYQPLWVH